MCIFLLDHFYLVRKNIEHILFCLLWRMRMINWMLSFPVYSIAEGGVITIQLMGENLLVGIFVAKPIFFLRRFTQSINSKCMSITNEEFQSMSLALVWQALQRSRGLEVGLSWEDLHDLSQLSFSSTPNLICNKAMQLNNSYRNSNVIVVYCANNGKVCLNNYFNL